MKMVGNWFSKERPEDRIYEILMNKLKQKKNAGGWEMLKEKEKAEEAKGEMKLAKEEEKSAEEMGKKRNRNRSESSTRTGKDFEDDGYAGSRNQIWKRTSIKYANDKKKYGNE